MDNGNINEAPDTMTSNYRSLDTSHYANGEEIVEIVSSQDMTGNDACDEPIDEECYVELWTTENGRTIKESTEHNQSLFEEAFVSHECCVLGTDPNGCSDRKSVV